MCIRAALVGVGLLLTGCASPDPRLYALEPIAGSPLRSPAETVVVRSAVVPRYLERIEIVDKAENGRVHVSGNDWWSEPLRQMLQHVLAADLAQRLPGASVLGTESLGGEGASVVLAVERFEPDGAGATVLDGYLAVEFGDGKRVLRRVSARVPMSGDRMADQVAAMSRALATVADTAAAILTRPGPTPSGGA